MQIEYGRGITCERQLRAGIKGDEIAAERIAPAGEKIVRGRAQGDGAERVHEERHARIGAQACVVLQEAVRSEAHDSFPGALQKNPLRIYEGKVNNASAGRESRGKTER